MTLTAPNLINVPSTAEGIVVVDNGRAYYGQEALDLGRDLLLAAYGSEKAITEVIETITG